MRASFQSAGIYHTIAFQAMATVVLVMLLASCSTVSSFNAAIALSGQVEDADGRPLEQVRLSARRNRFSLMAESFLSSSKAELDLTDGRFRVNCRSCSSVNLFFSKDGYYSEEVNFHVEKAEQPGNRSTSEVAIDLKRSDLRIVMRSARNKARLVEYSSFMSSAAEGPVTVAPLRRGLGAWVKPERLSEPLDNDKDPRNLPGYVRLQVAVTDGGTLAADDPSARFPAPLAPILDFTEADGGVVLYELTAEKPQAVYRAMRTAPTEGYQASITLESGNRSGRLYYFYCRIGDRYGKGSVVVPSFGHADDGREVVVAHIEIRLNLDGSRNVETAH